jgi:hypothetical protein
MIDLFREAFKDEYILCEEVLNTTLSNLKKVTCQLSKTPN